MWCTTCQQDVPGIASLSEDRFVCPRCNEELGRDPRLAAAPHANDILDQGIELDRDSSTPQAPPAAWDDWEAEEKLQRAERLFRTVSPSAKNDASPSPAWRIDMPAAEHSRMDAPSFSHWPPSSYGPGWPYTPGPEARAKSDGWLGVLAQVVIAVGLMALACGSVLLVWSLAAGRNELWNLGLPLALGGQVVVLAGGLAALYHGRRRTAHAAQQFSPPPSAWFGAPNHYPHLPLDARPR